MHNWKKKHLPLGFKILTKNEISSKKTWLTKKLFKIYEKNIHVYHLSYIFNSFHGRREEPNHRLTASLFLEIFRL
jgi:hypothetical protein